jgi:phage/plasmid-like protein (TIGR03299 family)
MAHLFQSGLFFGESAWHGLGNTLAADSPLRFDIPGAMRESGTNWSVETRDVSTVHNGANVNIASHRAVVRTDTGDILGVVGERYRPLQNAEQFAWFAPFLETREVALETCGALKGGAIVWILARILREDATVSADDKIRKYLLLSSSHDGSMATNVGFNPIRVVCWNTLSAALATDSRRMLKIKHTDKQHDALRLARECVNLADRQFDATAEQYRKLLACRVDRSDIVAYVRKVFDVAPDAQDKDISTRQRNILDRVITLATSGVGNDGKTVWSAYNGVTQYITHEQGRNADSRLRSTWYGDGAKMNARALSLALTLAS